MKQQLPDNRRRRTRVKAIPQADGLTTRRLRIDKRNRILIARFYYWTEIRRVRFDDTLRILTAQEFFVEERTISNALLDLSDYLDELYKTKKTGKELRAEYPNWDWSSE